MGEWYIVRGNMDDGCRKYTTKVIVYAETVNEAKSKAKSIWRLMQIACLLLLT